MSEKNYSNNGQKLSGSLSAKLSMADSFAGKAVKRLEAFFTPKHILIFTVVFLLLHWVFSLCFNYQLYRDVAGVYAWYARELGRGNGYAEAITKVPPLNIVLAAGMVFCGIEAYTALICISMFMAILTLIPLYKMLRLFVSEKMAAWGCLLFAFAPKSLRFFGTGLLESTRDLFLVSAIYLVFKSWRNECRYYHWMLLGGLLGLLCIARGEGAVLAGAIALGILVRPSTDYRSLVQIAKKILYPVAVTAVVGLLVISPVVFHNYKVTGYPVTDARQISLLEVLPGVRNLFTVPAKVVQENVRLLPKTPQKRNDCQSTSANLERLQQLLPKAFRGGYELYMVLAIIGIALLIWQKKWRKEYTFLLAYCVTMSLVFVFHAVAHRYFIFYIPLLMVFTLTALNKLLEISAKYSVSNLVISIAGLIIFLQPFDAWSWMASKSDYSEVLTGKYIKANRQKFLPENAKDRKLVIHGDMRVVYHCDEARLFDYGEAQASYQYTTGFDLLLIRRKEREELKACMERPDLQCVESPTKDFVIFVPKNKIPVCR